MRLVRGDGRLKQGALVLAVLGATAILAAGLAFGVTSGRRSNVLHRSSLASSSLSFSVPGTTDSSVPATTPTTSVPLTGPSSAGSPDVPTAGGASPGVGGFDAVTCPSSSFCLAVGADASGSGVAATSSDGGATWTSEDVPSQEPELDAVACADAETCVAVGSETEMSTADGGTTWSSQPLPVPNATLLGVTCTSTLLCVAVGVARDSIGPYSAVVLTSNDGGSSWSAASVPSGSLGVGSVVCPTSTDCLAVGATILTSSDGGATWQGGTVNGGSQPVRTLSCSSPEVCVAVGPNSTGLSDQTAPATAIVTTDGGTTWNPESLPSGTSGVNQVSCADSTQCTAAGSSLSGPPSTQIVTSADGGQTWSLPSTIAGLTSVASVSCPAEDSCVAVGQSSSGAATSTWQDGTWTTEPVTQEVGGSS